MLHPEHLLVRYQRRTIAILLTPAAALALATAATTVARPASPSASAPEAGLVWGDRVFVAKRPFSTWLKLHGSTYRSWRRHHPQAALRLKRNPRGA